MRFDPWPRSVGWGFSVAVSCGVGCRRGSDLTLLRLCCSPAAVAPIQPLAWKSLYAEGAVLKKERRGGPVVVQWLTNPTRNHADAGSIPGLVQWVKGLALLVSCGVGWQLQLQFHP